jgi:hypothetical protein
MQMLFFKHERYISMQYRWPFVLEGKGMIYFPALVQTSLSYLKQYVLARALAPMHVQVLLQKGTISGV